MRFDELNLRFIKSIFFIQLLIYLVDWLCPVNVGRRGEVLERDILPLFRSIVLCNFQNMVHFLEKVSKLPRIVNVSVISMGDRKEIKGR